MVMMVWMTKGLIEKVKKDLPQLSEDVSAISINRREYFMRRWMKHGGAYPKAMVRIIRKGKARFEARMIDEHVEIKEGKSIYWNVDLCDDKIITLTKWIAAHNMHAVKEKCPSTPKIRKFPVEAFFLTFF